MKKRIISILTVLAMFLSLCPVWTLAAEPDPAPSPAGDYDTSADTAPLPRTTARTAPASNTGDFVASVTTSEEKTTYYSTIDAAWDAAMAEEYSITLTLLADAQTSKALTVDNGKSITIKGGNYKLTNPNPDSDLLVFKLGSLHIESGTFSSIRVEGYQQLIDALAQGCCYYHDGNPVDMKNSSLTRLADVTVGACSHKDVELIPNSDGYTHALDCPYCNKPNNWNRINCTFESVDPVTRVGRCICGRTAAAEASVTIDGVTKYYPKLEAAIDAVGKTGPVGTVNITILTDLVCPEDGVEEGCLELMSFGGSQITLDGCGYTLSGYRLIIMGVPGPEETSGGMVKLIDCTIDGGQSPAVSIEGANVRISDCEFTSSSAPGLYLRGGDVQITSGTFTGVAAIFIQNYLTLADLLAEDSGYFLNDERVTEGLDGKALPANFDLEDIDPDNPTLYTYEVRCGTRWEVTLSGAEGLVYDGSAKTPAVTVTKINSKNESALVDPSTYTVAYANNVNAGTASVTAVSKDAGWTAKETFTIAKADPRLTLAASPAALPNGGAVTLTLTGLPAGGTASVTCSGGIPVTAQADGTWTAVLPAGDAGYTFTAVYAGNQNYNRAETVCDVVTGGYQVKPALSLTASPASLTGGGTVTLTLGGLPAGETVSVTCSGGIPVTAGEGGVWTAVLPNRTASYTFTASFAGSAVYQAAEASCVVTVEETAVPPDNTDSRLEVKDGITEVPEGLRDIPALNTPEKLELHMRTMITQASPDIPEDRTAVYDVTLQISNDGGKTWIPATKDNFPAGGLSVTLPYPAGTDSSYTFTVVHMFTTSDFGKTPGDTETPAVTNTENGVRFTVTGLSPISVGWTAPASKPGTPSSGGGGGGGGASRPSVVQKPDVEEPKPLSDRFADLGGVGMWYYDAVEFVLQKGLMNGFSSTLFGPNENLSRAQLAQILYNREGRPSVTDSGVFADVDSGAWYAPAIVWASGSGIAGGYGDGTFGPNDPVTREQLAVMLWRYAGNPAATNKELRFADADSVSGYALEALRWAVENGIVSGMGGGVLDPKGLATRAQAAQMLKNFLDR